MTRNGKIEQPTPREPRAVQVKQGILYFNEYGDMVESVRPRDKQNGAYALRVMLFDVIDYGRKYRYMLVEDLSSAPRPRPGQIRYSIAYNVFKVRGNRTKLTIDDLFADEKRCIGVVGHAYRIRQSGATNLDWVGQNGGHMTPRKLNLPPALAELHQLSSQLMGV